MAELADRLAQVTAARGRRELARRGIDVAGSGLVRWAWEAGSARGRDTRFRGSAAALRDEVYGPLGGNRLVILGGAGAGKSTAMITLMLAALVQRTGLDDLARARVPVPVWLSLRRWDMRTGGLLDWAASAIRRDYPRLTGRRAARDLLRDGRVALFLDGLDEVPEGSRARLLELISTEAAGLRVVLTSRSRQYLAVRTDAWLADTTEIRLLPVSPADGAAYLTASAPGPVLERLASDLAHDPEDELCRELSTPLALCLARDAYADPADDPVFPDARALRAAIADQLLTRAYPDAGQRTRAVPRLGAVAEWAGSVQDLGWWRFGDWAGPARLARGLIFAVAVAFFAAPFGLITSARDGLLWFGAGLLAGLVFAAQLTGKAMRLDRTLVFPETADPARLPVLRRPRRPGEYLRCALGACLLFVLPGAVPALWSFRADPGSTTAARLYRGNRRASVFRLLAWSQCGVPLHILIFALGGAPGTVLLVAALPLGVVWLLLLTQGFFAVKLAELLRPPAHGRPVSFYRLLEDALDRQVLRQEGMYYEFRWPPLQEHLAALALAAESSRLRATRERRQAGLGSKQAAGEQWRPAVSPQETGPAAAVASRSRGLRTRLTPAVTGRLATDLAWGMTGAVYIGCAALAAGPGSFNPWAAAAVMAVTAGLVLAATGAAPVPGWLRGPCSRAWLRIAGAPVSSVAADADERAADFWRWLGRNAKRLAIVAGLLAGWGIAASWRLSSWLPPREAGSVVWVLAVLAAPFCLVTFPLWRVLALRLLGALRAADAGFAAGCAIAIAIIMLPFGALILLVAGPRGIGDGVARIVFWLLPAALTAATGGWLSLLLDRKVRGSASRWLAHAGDVLLALVTGFTVVLLIRPGLLGRLPAAGLLFPPAAWLGYRVWRRMNGSPRFPVKAAADIVFSLVLGADAVLALVWAANLTSMSAAKVAVLRAVAHRAGDAADLPWWLWGAVYLLLAGATVAVLRWPAGLARLRRVVTSGPLVPGVDAARRSLTGAHIGLLVVVLIGMAGPASVGPVLRTQLDATYTEALAGNQVSSGELAAYQEIDRQLSVPSQTQLAPLTAVVAYIEEASGSPSGDDATSTELDLARRVAELQASALALTAPADPSADVTAASAAADGTSVRKRTDQVAAALQAEEATKRALDQAGELAATALSNALQIPYISANATYQIVREYLSSLIEASPLTGVLTAWAGRVSGAARPPGAQAMVVPDPGRLDRAAAAALAEQVAATPADGESAAQLTARIEDAAGSLVAAAVDLANQARYLAEDSGPCAGCAPPAPPVTAGGADNGGVPGEAPLPDDEPPPPDDVHVEP
jgi:hypothetical protein